MNREDVVRMAREAGFGVAFPESTYDFTGAVFASDENITDELERFAALVAAAEREACATLVDHILCEGGGTYGDAIRARIEE